MASDRDIWIIVPAFNEAAALATTLTPLCHHYTNVVVVDDGSTDDTGRIASRYPVFRLQHLLNRGQGAALRSMQNNMNRNEAVLYSYQRCALAMTQTTLIAGLGLVVFGLSSFQPVSQFGLLMFLLLAAALVGDLLFLPSLLIGPAGKLFQPKRKGDEPVTATQNVA